MRIMTFSECQNTYKQDQFCTICKSLSFQEVGVGVESTAVVESGGDKSMKELSCVRVRVGRSLAAFSRQKGDGLHR